MNNIEQHKMKIENPKAPTLRGQPKTHKPGNPIRPIVNFRCAPTYNICKYLNNKIKTSLNWKYDYSLKNTWDLTNKIKNIPIPNNTLFISFDIVNMYSNIPTVETLKILKEDLSENVTNNKKDINDIVALTKTTLKQNYFEFNSNFYLQKDGLAMGSPLSGLLAEIYMHNLEAAKIMDCSNPFKRKIIYWYRYVDDIICLFDGNEDEAKAFLDYLNSLSNKIKFTIEIQRDKINFLDITISKESGNHSFNIYRKSTQTDLIIPSNSNHPWQQKMTTFHSLINRLLSIPMNENNYKKEVKMIKHLAAVNGYKEKTIDKIIKKTKVKKMNTNTTTTKNEEEKQEFITIPYNTNFNKAIRKTFEKSKMKIAYKTNNNTFNIINKMTKNHTKYKKNDFNKAGVYKINCSDCESYYIGKTKRNFQTRFKEHIQALRSNNITTMKSNFADHLIKTNHNYKNINENLKVLNYENDVKKLTVKEDFQIYTHYKKDSANMLNTMQLQNNNPLFEYIMQI